MTYFQIAMDYYWKCEKISGYFSSVVAKNKREIMNEILNAFKEKDVYNTSIFLQFFISINTIETK